MPDRSGRDLQRIQKAIAGLLAAIRGTADAEMLRTTAANVAEIYATLLEGAHGRPEEYLRASFAEDYDEIVLLRNISFCSLCQCHLLPLVGLAHIAYVPSGKVLGMRKFGRVVECFAGRPQLQEALTGQIADSIMGSLKPKGVAVVVEALHTCTALDYPAGMHPVVVTSALRGLLRKDPRSRGEVMSLLHGRRNGGPFFT